MKKTLITLLAVVLMFSLAIPVFAEDVSSDDVSGETSQVVTATREQLADKTPETVYFVTVSWNVTSELKYTVDGSTYTWNPADTEYTETPGEATWDGSATVAITVANRSNAEITAEASWAAASTIEASECKFAENQSKVTVESAAKDTNLADKELKGAEQSKTINATVTVSRGSIDTNGATVGTVTLKIEKVA